MIVLVDTTVWSLAFRRQDEDLNTEQRRIKEELAELIRERRAQLIGPIRQELLSGIRNEFQYYRLRMDLRAFDEPRLSIEDYEEAARASNECRNHGVVGSAIDFLICAVALRHNWQIFTTDDDFLRYARHLPLRLYRPRSQPASGGDH